MKKFNNGDVVLCKNVIGEKYLLCKVIDSHYSSKAIELQILKNNVYTVVSLIYCKKVTCNTIKKEIQKELKAGEVTEDDLNNNVFYYFISIELLRAIKQFSINFIKLNVSNIKVIKHCNKYDNLKDIKKRVIFDFFDNILILDNQKITIAQFKKSKINELTE